MGLGAYWGDFAKGFADRGDYWRGVESKAATKLQQYIKSNPHATQADIIQHAKSLGVSDWRSIITEDGIQRALQVNADALARTKKKEDFADLQAQWRRDEHADGVWEGLNNSLQDQLNIHEFGSFDHDSYNALVDSIGKNALTNRPHDSLNINKWIDSTTNKSQSRLDKRAAMGQQNEVKAAEDFRQWLSESKFIHFHTDDGIAAKKSELQKQYRLKEDVEILSNDQITEITDHTKRTLAKARRDEHLGLTKEIENALGSKALSWKNEDEAKDEAKKILEGYGQDYKEFFEKWDWEQHRKDEWSKAYSNAMSSHTIQNAAKNYGNADEVIKQLGWGQYNVPEYIKSQIEGVVTAAQPDRDAFRQTTIDDAITRQVANTGKVLTDYYKGADKNKIKTIVDALNTGPLKNFTDVTEDEVATALYQVEYRSHEADLKSRLEALTTSKPNTPTMSKSDLMDEAKGSSGIGKRSLNEHKRQALMSMINIGLVFDQVSLSIAEDFLRTRRSDSRIDWENPSASNIALAHTVGKEILNDPVFATLWRASQTAVTAETKALWSKLSAEQSLVLRPTAYADKWESATNEGGVLYAEIDKIFADFGSEDTPKATAAPAVINAIAKARARIGVAKGHLRSRGSALPREEYQRIVAGIAQAEELLNSYNDRANEMYEAGVAEGKETEVTTAPAPQPKTVLSDEEATRIALEIQQVLMGKREKTSDGIGASAVNAPRGMGDARVFGAHRRDEMIRAYAEKYGIDPTEFGRRIGATVGGLD